MTEVETERAARDIGTAHIISIDRYRELGGIINEADYHDALVRAGKTARVNTHFVAQAEMIAHHAGFVLDNTPDHLDPVTILYGVLRKDRKQGVEYYHGQMSDQRLFAEVLRMLDYPDLLKKMRIFYSNMSF